MLVKAGQCGTALTKIPPLGWSHVFRAMQLCYIWSHCVHCFLHWLSLSIVEVIYLFTFVGFTCTGGRASSAVEGKGAGPEPEGGGVYEEGRLA